MNKFNRMNEFFDGDFDANDEIEEREIPSVSGFVYRVNLPDPPDRVNQTFKVINGKLTICLEFEFDDFDLLDTPDDM